MWFRELKWTESWFCFLIFIFLRNLSVQVEVGYLSHRKTVVFVKIFHPISTIKTLNVCSEILIFCTNQPVDGANQSRSSILNQSGDSRCPAARGRVQMYCRPKGSHELCTCFVWRSVRPFNRVSLEQTSIEILFTIKTTNWLHILFFSLLFLNLIVEWHRRWL